MFKTDRQVANDQEASCFLYYYTFRDISSLSKFYRDKYCTKCKHDRLYRARKGSRHSDIWHIYYIYSMRKGPHTLFLFGEWRGRLIGLLSIFGLSSESQAFNIFLKIILTPWPSQLSIWYHLRVKHSTYN